MTSPAINRTAGVEPGAGDALLEVSSVTLRYKTQSAAVTATERVSFRVNASDRFVLLGPSGCGKSTLLKAVGGYLQPSEGSISIKGRQVKGPGPDRMMVFQEFDQLLPWKTVLQNVMFPLLNARRLPHAEAEARARVYVEKVGLTRVVDSFPHMLSGGMKQRVAIARCMAMEPDILLMDEWLSVGDATFMAQAEQRLLSLVDGAATVVFASHVADQIRKICTKAALIVEGELVDVGPVENVLKQYDKLQAAAQSA